MEHLQQFAAHLKSQLSFKDFQALPTTLNMTLYRLNKLLKGKEDWRLREIHQIAEVLDIDPVKLIQDWRLGHKHLTLKEMDQILSDRGMEVTFQEKAV